MRTTPKPASLHSPTVRGVEEQPKVEQKKVDGPAPIVPGPRDGQQFGAGAPVPVDLNAKLAQTAHVPLASDGLWMTSLPEPTHAGPEWVAQQLGDVKLNLGGEGEVKGFVNVNPMMGNLQSLEAILKRDPAGAVMDAGAEKLPYPDRSVREIRGNALPSPVLGRYGKEIAAEIKRVLVSGGTAQFSSRTPFASDLQQHLTSLGFQMVGQNLAKFTQP